MNSRRCNLRKKRIRRFNPKRVKQISMSHLTLSSLCSLSYYSVGFTYGYSHSSPSDYKLRNISYKEITIFCKSFDFKIIICCVNSFQLIFLNSTIRLIIQYNNQIYITSFKTPLFSLETFRINSAIKPVQPVW